MAWNARIGKVSSVEPGKGMCSVTFDAGDTSAMLPCLCLEVPEKEQMAAVLYTGNGDAVVLGRIWTGATPPGERDLVNRVGKLELDHAALEKRVSDLEQRVSALEARD